MSTRPSALRTLGLVLAASVLQACVGPGAPPASTSSILTGTTLPSTTTTQAPSTTTAPSTTSPAPPTPSDIPTRWELTNPGGGGAYSEAAITGDVLVVATDLAGVAVSVDGAGTWATRGAFAGLADTHAAAVAVDPDDPTTIVVGTDGGLYRSTDAGATFAALEPVGFVSAVAARGDTLYAAVQSAYDVADAAVMVSHDAGATWTTLSLPAGRHVVAFDIDPTDARRALVVTGAGRFVDGPAGIFVVDGDRISRVDADIGRIVDAAFDRHHTATIWATTDDDDPDAPGHLWRRDDRHWSLVADHGGVLWLPSARPGTIRLVDPRRQFPWDERSGVWESTDGGGTWEHVGAVDDWQPGWSRVPWAFTDGFDGPVPSLAVDPADPDRALLVNSQFAYLTTDGGRTFTPAFTDEVAPGRWRSRGLDNVVVADVAVSADGATLYAGYWDLGCWRSPDRGASWENCNTVGHSGDWEGSGGFTGTVAADPTRPEVVWAAHAPDWASSATILRSIDRGATWEETSGLPDAPDLLGLSVDPTSPSGARVLYVTHDGDVYRSADDGRTWVLDFACGGCRTTTVGPDGQVYAGGEAGLWFRQPDGTWLDTDSTGLGGDVDGPPWTFRWRGVTAIAVAGDGEPWVAVLGDDGGILRPDGDGWEAVRSGRFYRDLAFDPDDPTILYAASSSALDHGGYDPGTVGLEVSIDGGATWRVADDGLAWPFVTNVTVDGGMVLVGSPGTGVAVGR